MRRANFSAHYHKPRYPLISSNSSYLLTYISDKPPAARLLFALGLLLTQHSAAATGHGESSTQRPRHPSPRVDRTTLQWEEDVPRARSQHPPISLTPHCASFTSSRDHHDHLVRSEESSSASQVRPLPRMCVMRASPTVLSVSFRRLLRPLSISPAPAKFSKAVASWTFIRISSLPAHPCSYIAIGTSSTPCGLRRSSPYPHVCMTPMPICLVSFVLTDRCCL